MAILSLRPDAVLFDRLGVYPTASAEEIWFAYFFKVYEHLKGRARDIEAEDLSKLVIEESLRDDARLMELTEAFQVLSDPGRREAYVNHGTRPGPASLVHYSVILQMVFGSVAFQNYVGMMKLNSLANVMEARDPHDTSKNLMNRVLTVNTELLQEKVTYLVGVMNHILDLSSKDLRRRAKEEAQGFSQGYTAPPRAFCREMLKTIGPIYKSNAVKLRPSRDPEQANPEEYSTYQKEETLWKVCRSTVLENVTDGEKKKRAKKLQELGEILEKTGSMMGENSGRTTVLINFIRNVFPF